ncbi:MAG TPA: cobalt ECF transporter T component CbiQ [Thermoleophilia bacterium]|nr:cobalt ECF transporter T component CbiQ [Thermoleophilia bacterium]
MAGTHHFLTDVRYGTSPIHALDPRTKLLSVLALAALAVSTPPTAVWAFAVYLAAVFFVLGLARLPLGYVLRRALIILPFILAVVVFLPFFDRAGSGSYEVGGVEISHHGLLILWNVAVKALISVVAAIILISTTSFPELIRGLEGLHVPRVFTLVAGFMYRYGFLFLEEAGRMRRAMTSRNYSGRWLWDARLMGHLIAALFLRSYARAERVYVAMVSRGFEGTMPGAVPLNFRTADYAFLGALLGLLGVVRVAVAMSA